MARMKIKLDAKGLEHYGTTSDMHRAIDAAAEAVAENVRGQGRMVEGEPGDVSMPVNVYGNETTTNMRVNRAKSYVTLAHAAGQADQAKNGTLTKAAAQAGLTVKDKS